MVTPRDGDAVITGSLHLSLRVRAGTRIVSLEVGRRSVRRYVQQRGTRLVGNVPRALLGTGPQVLRIVARSANGKRRDVDLVELLAARRRSTLLTTTVRTTGHSPGGVLLRLRTPAHAHVQATLNGHRIDDALVRGRPGERTLQLNAFYGLHHGRNRLVVVAHDRRRYADVETHVITVPRRAPLPGVHIPRVARKGVPTVLDARTTRALHRGDRLAYRWRVVVKPRGSHPRIKNPTSPVARLVPDRVGHYRLRLLVTERGRAHAAAAQAAQPGSLDEDVDTACTTASPYGLALDTSPGTPSVQFAGQTYAGPTQQGAIQVLIIDRLTGCTESTSIAPAANGARDVGTLANDILTASGQLQDAGDLDHITVLTAATAQSNGSQLGSKTTMSALASALVELGWDSSQAATSAATIAGGGQFSLIGIRGEDSGQAYANFDWGAGGAGALSGYLRPSAADPSGSLKFEPGQFVAFDVGAPGQPGTIGSGSSAVTIPDPGQGEIGITVFDAHTLSVRATATTAPVPASVNSPGPGGQNPAQVLNVYVNDPTALFVVRFRGRVAEYQDRDNLATFTQQLATIGVNRDLLIRSFAAPDPSDSHAAVWKGTDYTFIGGPGIADSDGSALKTVGSNVGPQVVSGPRLQGVLARDEHGRFQPLGASATAAGAFDTTLATLAAATPTNFSYPPPQDGDSPNLAILHYADAEARLFGLLVAGKALCDPNDPSNCEPMPAAIEGNYGNPKFLAHIEGNGSQNILDALQCTNTTSLPTGFYPAGADYNADELEALRVKVCGEMQDIATINDNLFTPLAAVLEDQLSETTLDLLSESDTLKGFIDQQQPVQSLNIVDLFAKVAAVLGEVADLGGPEGEEVGGPLSLLGDMLDLASEFTGSETTDDRGGQVEVTTGTLASWTANQFEQVQSTLGEVQAIIDTDPVKLATVAAKAANGGLWDLSDTPTQTDLANQGRFAAASYMWPRLLASAFKQPSCKPSAGDYNPKWYGPTTSDPLSYVAAIDVGDFMGDNQQQISFPFFWTVPSVSLNSNDAKTIANSVFWTFDPSASPTPGGIVQADFAMKLGYPENNLCQPPSDWIGNHP